jgi:hypothetical protein
MTNSVPPYFSDSDVPPPLDGEDPDIRKEAEQVAGPDWLKTPNPRFGGRKPEEVINDNKGYWVREVLRSIKYGEFS